jgi:pimeloyl-ACP methyl ester carboxylesterase
LDGLCELRAFGVLNIGIMKMQIKKLNEFEYIDEGQGQVMLLLHGLFGALSNWEAVVERFSKDYRVIIPMLPIYEMPLREAGLEGLTDFAHAFIMHMKLDNMIVMGNSLGGHIALIYTLRHPDKVDRLVLTGSSGLFENSMGGSFPRRGSYDFVKDKVAYTFYDPAIATKEFVDEIFQITKSIPKCMRIVAIAKSAQRNNMAEEIKQIDKPTLLVWGLNDTITPPMVAHEFHRLLRNSTLRFIDKCCHAPMMERPEEFNNILAEYLEKEAVA